MFIIRPCAIALMSDNKPLYLLVIDDELPTKFLHVNFIVRIGRKDSLFKLINQKQTC